MHGRCEHYPQEALSLRQSCPKRRGPPREGSECSAQEVRQR